jgi:hypothetical protein
MKLFMSLVLFFFAFASMAQDVSIAAISCGPNQHECQCATGIYCLRAGETCMTPTVSCPTQPTIYSSLYCGERAHECQCATGSYCLPIGYACLAPTAACPEK